MHSCVWNNSWAKLRGHCAIFFYLWNVYVCVCVCICECCSRFFVKYLRFGCITLRVIYIWHRGLILSDHFVFFFHVSLQKLCQKLSKNQLFVMMQKVANDKIYDIWQQLTVFNCSLRFFFFNFCFLFQAEGLQLNHKPSNESSCLCLHSSEASSVTQ